MQFNRAQITSLESLIVDRYGVLSRCMPEAARSTSVEQTGEIQRKFKSVWMFGKLSGSIWNALIKLSHGSGSW